MPGPLVTRRDIATGAVSFQKRRFGRPTGKAKEARVHFSWATAGEIVSMPHGLNAMPSTFKVVQSGVAAGNSAPKIYVPDPVFWSSRTHVALASDSATSWADVIVA